MSYFNSPAIITAQQEISTDATANTHQYANTQAYPSGTSLADYLRIIRKYFLSALFTFLSVVALTIFINSALVPKYVASATVRIDTNPQQILDYGINAGQPSKILDPTFLETQYKLLRSRKLATSVISELGLEPEQLTLNTFKPFIHRWLTPVKELKQKIYTALGKELTVTVDDPSEQVFLRNLTIRPIKNTQIIEVLYKSENAELSAQVVNQLVKSFIAYQIDTKKKSADKAEQFLRTELLNARHKLEASEGSLLSYAKQQNIINTGSDRSILEKNLEELSTAYIKAKEQRIIAESIYSKKHNVSGAMQATSSILIGTLKTQLADLSAKYQEGLKIYKPNYPSMQSLQAQINDIKTQVNRETHVLNSSVNKDLKASFLSAQQQERKLNGEIKRYEKRLLSFKNKNLHYVNLQREADTNRALYEGLLQRFKEVGVASGSGSEGIEVIDSAIVPLRSNSPKKGMNLVMGTMLGLLLAMLATLVRNLLNRKISTVEDLERLNLPYPVLTTLPKVKRSEEKTLPLLAVDKPNSALAESIRYLYTNLANQQGGIPKLLHITSALPSEGKSSIATNLATVLAKSGKKVLIIDGDLRRPSIHKHLHIDNEVGLSNYLVGKSPSIPLHKVSSKYDLYVIPAGPAVSDPVNLLSNQVMVELCENVRNAFDQIILDSPPVLGLADALVLSNRADATLFVVSSNQPNENDIQRALTNMEKGFANLIGLVFSKEKSDTTQYYSSFDYSDGRQALV